MFEWLAANWGTLAVGLMVLCVLVSVAYKLIKDKKHGKGTCSCDCGSCGAPTCRALAEDVVRGLAQETDCIFLMRRQIQQIATQLSKIEGFVPPEGAIPEAGGIRRR